MSNTVDIIFAQEAIASIKKTKDELVLVAAEILKISQNVTTLNNNFRNLHVPSDLTALNAANAQLTAQMQAQAAALAALQNQYNTLSQSRRTSSGVITQERVDTQILNTERRRELTLTSQVAGAYRKLSAEVAAASERYQNLLVRGRQLRQSQADYNRQLAEAQREFRTLQNRILAADNAVDKWNRTNKRTIDLMRDLVGAFGVAGGIAMFVQMGKSVYDLIKNMQSLDLALKSVTGTSSNFYAQQVFLNSIAEKHGLEIGNLTKQYTSFYVAAKDKLGNAKIQQIFEDIARSGSALGLSNETLERSFAAVNQMLSKGTLSAEELRQQFGEAMPGGIEAMRRAVQKLHPEMKDLTERQMFELIRKGQILSSGVLPEMGKQLALITGADNAAKIETITKSTNRLKDAWTDFVRFLSENDTIVSTSFGIAVKGSVLLLKGLKEVLATQGQINMMREGSVFQESYNDYNTLFDSQNAKKSKKEQLDILNKEKKDLEDFVQRSQNDVDKLTKKIQDAPWYAPESELKDTAEEIAINIGMSKGKLQAIQDRILEITDPKKKGGSKEDEKALDERLKNLYEYNKAVLELEIAKNTALVNNEDSYYTDRLTALDKLLVSQSKLTKLSFDEEIRLAKENDLKKKTALEKFNKDAFLIREEYLKKQADLEKLDLNQITTFAKSKDSDPLKDLAESGKEATRGLENTAEAVEKARKQLLELKKTTDEWLGSFSKDFLDSSGLGTISDYLDGTFNKLLEGAETVEEKFAVTFNSIAETAQEAFNFISNASQANFDAEYSRLESQKENALRFAGEGTAARKKIEDDYEKKKKEVANRENKAKQKQAIFNIAIDTAQAVVASFIKDPTGITAAIIAALGAAQIGVVAAQKIPQYFDGGIHGGGLAMINDSGSSNYVETVVTPDGKMKQFKGRDVVVDLPKGTEIRTPEQQYQKELEHMINSRGVMLNNQVSQVMTEEQLDRVMSKHFSKIQVSKTVYDKKGFSSYVEYQGNKTIRNANRASGTGFNV